MYHGYLLRDREFIFRKHLRAIKKKTTLQKVVLE